MAESLAQRLSRDLGGIYTAPEAAGETVSYLPKSAVDAVDVMGVFCYVESDAKSEKDGTGHLQQATFGPVSLALVSPRPWDTLTRSDGTEWQVTGFAASAQGWAILRIQQYDKVERSRPNYRNVR